MRGTRQPSAGPSARRNATGTTRRNPAPDPNSSIIDLSDSDDEELARERLKKRRRLGEKGNYLTGNVAGPSRPVHLAAPAAQRKGYDPSAAPKENTGNIFRRQQKAFPDFVDRMQPVGATRDEPIAVDAEEVDPNLEDHYLSHVLEVVPDVLPSHALELVRKHIPDYGSEVANNVVHMLFEDPSYPKIEQNKGKRKRDADEAVAAPPIKIVKTVDYGSTERPFTGGPYYYQMALDQLSLDFPYIPKPFVRQVLSLHRNFYAPAYLRLREDMKRPSPPFKAKATASRAQSKMIYHDDEYKLEREWLLQKLRSETEQPEAGPSNDPAPNDDGECEDGIECGCCFSSYEFDRMVQCPEAHLFCVTCMTSYVSDRLGQRDPEIKCMDQSGCKLLFSDIELKRFLPEKLWSLYERVKQTKEIEAAGLDGLEDCPFCDFKLVIENDEEKLFRCQNEECRVVSCRACKKVDHLPKSCKEADEEKGLDARHKVEEAMTEAIMRKCPSCKKPFVKELGCNKMTCPHCRTLSCYVCRKVIKGYDHFDQTPGGQRTAASAGKCALWDKVEERHEQEAAAARQRAIEQVQAENPDLDKKELDVELPKAAPAPAPVPAPAHQVAPHLHGHAAALHRAQVHADQMRQRMAAVRRGQRARPPPPPAQPAHVPLPHPQAQPMYHQPPPQPLYHVNVAQVPDAFGHQVHFVPVAVAPPMDHHAQFLAAAHQQHEANMARLRELQQQQMQQHQRAVAEQLARAQLLARAPPLQQQQPVMGAVARAMPGWGGPPNAQLRHHR